MVDTEGAVVGAADRDRDVEVVRLLSEGELTVEGRLTEASNATLYCRVDLEGESLACVYKPVAGERPLHDFPDGTLASRELAAYEVSEAAGWHIVPRTVERDGPFGRGMCQQWIEETDLSAAVTVLRDFGDEEAEQWCPVLAVQLSDGSDGYSRTATAGRCGASPCSTRWSTTPTARAVICCRWPTARCSASTTG